MAAEPLRTPIGAPELTTAKNLTPPWRPGQSGNPSGKPKLPEELRGIHSLTQLEVNKLVSKYARMTKEEILVVIKDSNTPMLELCIARIYTRASKFGDYSRLAFLMDRALGKIPVAEDTDEDKEARKEIESLSDQELLRLVVEKLPSLESKKTHE